MELHNKTCTKVLVKGMKKLGVNQRILNAVQVQTNNVSASITKQHVVAELNQYSEKPIHDEVSFCQRSNWNEVKEYKLAIIVPVYNGEEFIEQCLNSLLGQKTTYTYQIILVNDGSTDGTAKVIEPYVRDKKILYVNQKNKGHSGARNTALELVNAEYITFVDADDYVSENLVQSLVHAAQLYDADVVQGGFEKIMLNGRITKKSVFQEELVKNKYTVSGYPWGKVFRASLFEKIQFPEGYWFEDSIMSHLIYALANKIVTIPEIVYFYRVNMKGVSYTSDRCKKCIDSSWVLEEMLVSRRNLGIINDKRYLELFLDQIAINYKREFNVNDRIKKLLFLYNSSLLEEFFSIQHYDGLNENKKKLVLALKNKDYSAYKKICLFS